MKVRCPETLDVRVSKTHELRYGENPHQSAALYASGRGGIAAARKLHGKELSFNNLVDLDAAWQLIQRVRSSGGGHYQTHQSMRLRRTSYSGRGFPQSPGV